MVWTIQVNRLPLEFLGIGGGHLYIDIWKDNGSRFTQINGLAQPSDGGEPKTIGNHGDFIHVFTDRVLDNSVTSVFTQGSGITLFQTQSDGIAAEAEIRSILNGYIVPLAEYVNSQQLHYDFLGAIGFFNSNAVFSAVASVLQQALNISPAIIDAAKTFGETILPPSQNFGVNDDLFQGDLLPYFSPSGSRAMLGL